jgi:hypothetical protein
MDVMLHGRYRIAVSTMQNRTGLPLLVGLQPLHSGSPFEQFSADAKVNGFVAEQVCSYPSHYTYRQISRDGAKGRPKLSL